jgi:hypothetical protein
MDGDQGAVDWRGWLAELWAKEPVKIVIEGPLGDTSAALYLKQQDGDWGPEAVWTGALDFEGAMDGLWDNYEANLAEDEKQAAEGGR